MLYISFIYFTVLQGVVADLEGDDDIDEIETAAATDQFSTEKMLTEPPESQEELALRNVLEGRKLPGGWSLDFLSSASKGNKVSTAAGEKLPQGHLRAAHATHTQSHSRRSQQATAVADSPSAALMTLLEENAQLRSENKELRQEEHFLTAEVTRRALDQAFQQPEATKQPAAAVTSPVLSPQSHPPSRQEERDKNDVTPQGHALTQLNSNEHEKKSNAAHHLAHADTSGLFASTARAAQKLHRMVKRIGANAMRVPESAFKSLRDSTQYEKAVRDVRDSAQRLDRGVAAVAKGAVAKQEATQETIADALQDAYEAGEAAGREGTLDYESHNWLPGRQIERDTIEQL